MSDDLVEAWTSFLRQAALVGAQNVRSAEINRVSECISRASDKLQANAELIQEMRGALDRQCDNMAFIVNHVGIPNAWLEKFMRELEEDRKALSKAKSQQEGETE